MRAETEESGAPITIRSLRADDTDAVVALYVACMATEPDIGPLTAEGWESYMRRAWSGYGRDFLVVTAGAHLIGLAESALRDSGPRLCRLVKILVDPAHRRLGLGTRLLRMVLDQRPPDEPVLIETVLCPGWTAGLGFVSRFGFMVTETEIIMRCPALGPCADGPAGLAIARTKPEAAAERVAAIHNAAYRGETGFVPSTGCDMVESLRDAELWTARLAGEIVAFVKVEREQEFDWVESLAVDPPHQGRGIAGVLATRALSNDGVGERRAAWLNVSASNVAARKLYARLRFEKHSERPRYGALRDELQMQLDG